MEFEKFEALKATLNEEQVSALSEIESQARTLHSDKETAVLNEKKFRGFKQQINTTFGLDSTMSVDDSLVALGELNSGMQSKIDSFSKNASGKDTELAGMREQLDTNQKAIQDLTGMYDKERATNTLNDKKAAFTKHLLDNGIKQEALEYAISGNITQLSSVEDIPAFAKSFIENNPYLQSSSLPGGSGSRVSNNVNHKKTLAECTTKQERAAFYQNKIDNKG